jgi:hypothetical protein
VVFSNFTEICWKKKKKGDIMVFLSVPTKKIESTGKVSLKVVIKKKNRRKFRKDQERVKNTVRKVIELTSCQQRHQRQHQSPMLRLAVPQASHFLVDNLHVKS